MSSPSPEPPTTRQLRHLRTLADRTGTTFTNPATRSEASAQIRALKTRRRDPRRPWQALGRDDRQPLAYGAAVDPSEIEGYGSVGPVRADVAHRQEAEPIGTKGPEAGGLVRLLIVPGEGDDQELCFRTVRHPRLCRERANRCVVRCHGLDDRRLRTGRVSALSPRLFLLDSERTPRRSSARGPGSPSHPPSIPAGVSSPARPGQSESLL